MKGYCENCKYYEYYEGEEGEEGKCHFFPPQILLVGEDPMTFFPDVERNDWCGRFDWKREDDGR
jgi:hypothetical protein